MNREAWEYREEVNRVLTFVFSLQWDTVDGKEWDGMKGKIIEKRPSGINHEIQKMEGGK